MYRHQQNMCLFLQTIQELQFPDVLMPTIEEVFVNENRIKLVYTVAALAHYLREIELTNRKIENLEKYLKFDGNKQIYLSVYKKLVLLLEYELINSNSLFAQICL